MIFLATALYTLHLITYPPGWRIAGRDEISGNQIGFRPEYAAMSANGTIASIVRSTATEHLRQGLLIIRRDGSTTILPRPTASVEIPSFPAPRECASDAEPGDCGSFSNVTLARDGTPFVTYSLYFSGAYSGVRRAALMWNGAWHLLRKQSVLKGLAKPMGPRNLSVAAADTSETYTYTADYNDLFPMEDLDDAQSDPRWMIDVSGATFPWGNVPLGSGDTTSIRGNFVAGFDAGLKIMGPPANGRPTHALRWDCARVPMAGGRCRRDILGTGVAYAVDPAGEVVGDDETHYSPRDVTFRRHGKPVLWSHGDKIQLSTGTGSAYAISTGGLIVGSAANYGFIANARASRPHAVILDKVTANLNGHHISSAFGVSDDGAILALVDGNASGSSPGKLAVLTPLRP